MLCRSYFVFGFVFHISDKVYAGWELYDNFNSGAIQSGLWNIEDPSATISPENGAVKFEHLSGHPEEPSWLIFKHGPETIKAARVRLKVKSCTGDVRARIGGWVGMMGEDYVWSSIDVWANPGRISGGVGRWSPPDYNELFLGTLQNPIDIIDEVFTIAMDFNNLNTRHFLVRDTGIITCELYESMAPTDDHFKGIGTRSQNGEGPCVVYFDDVYVWVDVFQIPTADITVDGNTADWSGVSPASTSPEGCNGDVPCVEGADVKNLWLSKNGNTLYFLFETWGQIDQIGEVLYRLWFDNNKNGQLDDDAEDLQVTAFYSEGSYEVACQTMTGVPINANGVAFGSGNFVEGSVDAGLLGISTSFTLESGTHDLDIGNFDRFPPIYHVKY